MNVVDLPVALVYPLDNALLRRKIDPARVAELADSIKEVGLISPILVRPATKHRQGAPADVFEVLGGNHRYEAFVKLGRETIPAQIMEQDDLRNELAVIDENLIRYDLSDAERKLQTKRRKEIYEIIHPETVHGAVGQRGKSRQNGDTSQERFTKATAAATGRSERDVQRDVKHADDLGDDLEKIKGTSLDRATEIDALAKMTPAERQPLVKAAQAGKKVSAKAPLTEKAATEKQVATLMAAWNRAGKEARDEFLSRIDKLVMDRQFA